MTKASRFAPWRRQISGGLGSDGRRIAYVNGGRPPHARLHSIEFAHTSGVSMQERVVMSHRGWFRGSIAAILVALSATQFVGLTGAQSLLTEPDFSGMHAPGGYVSSVARDSARGWNYVGGPYLTHLGGVATGSAIVRVNDAGFADPDWRVTDSFTSEGLGAMMVTSAGVLLVQKAARWRRLTQATDGSYASVPLGGALEFSGLTSGADGYVYGAQNNYRYNEPSQSLIKRLLPSGEYDAGWSMTIDSFSSGLRSIAVAANGDVAYVQTLLPGESKPSIGRRRSSGELLWTRLVVGIPAMIAVDDVGRTYVIGDGLVVDGRVGDVLRLLPSGEVDTSWTTPLDMAASNIVMARVAQGRLVIAGFAVNADEWMPSVFAVSTATGVVESRAPLDGIASGQSLSIAADGSALTTSGRAVSLHQIKGGGGSLESRTLLSDPGGPAYVTKVARWGSGYVLVGNFVYWYDGVQYNTLMRLDAMLRPDPAWRPEIPGVRGGGESVSAVAVDARGGLVVGGNFMIGSQRNLVRFAASGALDETWSPNPDAGVSQLYAAADGVLFVAGGFSKIAGATRRSLARFAPDGALDRDWAPTLPSVVGTLGVTQLVDMTDAGVVVNWVNFHFDNTRRGWVRVDRGRTGAELPSSLAVGDGDELTLLPDRYSGQLFALQSIVAYGPSAVTVRNTLTRRLPGTLAVDSTWQPLVLPGSAYWNVAGLDATHLYVSSYLIGTRRVHKGGAALDATWGVPQLPTYGMASADDSSQRLVLGYVANSLRPYLIDTTTRANAARNVVEYLALGNRHYFMTARRSEQALLDGLPANFVRTGMQFAAVDALSQAVIPDALQPSPICRFFSAPERGGSSTHFYGRQSDCQFLNTLTGISNEGYDFAAQLAIRGGCPAHAPIAVYRLFNNQSSSNNGNHRYVVSQTRRVDMKARGWIDEGIAFCAVSAVDASGSGG